MNKGAIIRVSILRRINLLPEHYGIYDGNGGYIISQEIPLVISEFNLPP